VTATSQFIIALGVIVASILLAFGFALTFADLKQYEELEEEKPTAHSDQPAEQHDDESAASCPPHDEAEAKRRKRQKTYRESQARLINITASLNVLTAIAAVAGFLALYVLYGTLIATQRQVVTAEENFEQSRRAAIFETRVEMIKASPELLKEFPKDATAAIDTHFKNFGPTPATEVIEMSSPCLLKGDIPSNFSYRDLGELPHPKRLVPPQGEFIDGVPSRAEDIDAVTTYQASLFVWGTVTYTDVFKKSHFTAFCVKYEATGQIGSDSKSRVQEYEQCSDHNCVDENCPKNLHWGDDDSIDCLNVGPSQPTRVPYPNSQPTP